MLSPSYLYGYWIDKRSWTYSTYCQYYIATVKYVGPTHKGQYERLQQMKAD